MPTIKACFTGQAALGEWYGQGCCKDDPSKGWGKGWEIKICRKFECGTRELSGISDSIAEMF